MPTTSLAYPTIGDIRERCLALDLPASAQEVQALIAARPRLQIDRALLAGSADVTARSFLSRAIDEVRQSTRSLFPERNLKSALSHGTPLAVAVPARFPSAVRSHAAKPAIPSPRPSVPGGLLRGPDSHAIHTSRAALTFSTGTHRGKAVIVMDATPARGIDGLHKITLVLTPDETLLALAVFVGDLPHARCARGQDKWIDFTHQGGQVFVRAALRSQTLAIPVGALDAFRVAVLMLTQIKTGLPGAAQTDTLTLLRKTVARMASISPANPQHHDAAPESNPVDAIDRQGG